MLAILIVICWAIPTAAALLAWGFFLESHRRRKELELEAQERNEAMVRWWRDHHIVPRLYDEDEDTSKINVQAALK